MLSNLIKRDNRHVFSSVDEYVTHWANRIKGGSGSSSMVSTNKALNHSAVWAGTDFISSTLAMLPLKIFGEREWTEGENDFTYAVQQKLPISKLINKPNLYQTGFSWRQVQQAQAIFHGAGYAWIERERNASRNAGDVKAIWPLNASNTRWDEDNEVFRTIVNGKSVQFPWIDVLHIPGFSLDGEAMSFINYAAEIINLGLAAQDFGQSFFGSGANPRFIITHPEQIDANAADRLANQFDRIYGGNGNAHKAAVIDEGMTAQPLTIAPEQAQFLDTRRDNRIEIAGMMRIPPQMIGIYDRVTWSNAEQMDIFVLKYTLSSWLSRWEQELNIKLLDESQQEAGFHFKFNHNALLRGDINARSEFYKTMMQGVMTGNEIRTKEDLQPLPGLDEPLVPLNMGTVNNAAKADKKGNTDET